MDASSFHPTPFQHSPESMFALADINAYKICKSMYHKRKQS